MVNFIRKLLRFIFFIVVVSLTLFSIIGGPGDHLELLDRITNFLKPYQI